MLIIGNGLVITRDEENSVIYQGAVVIEGKIIIKVGKTEEIIKEYEDYEYIDAKGKLIMPGFINTHMHYYSTFARGMANDSPPAKSFTDILKGLWWRLDKQLTLEDVYYSALIPMIDQVKMVLLPPLIIMLVPLL